MAVVLAILVLAVCGGGMIVAGTYIIAGLGVAFLACGVLLFAAALALRYGMRANA